ncbi:MAG: AIR carboxylase family protein [Patescibacteria group bacterium]|nr:AIR carboxylase family protein [Patescibacteria group bacterium]
MRRGLIIIGSESDLKQCRGGLQWILKNPEQIIVEKIHVASQHRHTLRVQRILTDIWSRRERPDFIILGAGWANHLTGCGEAFLRYQLRDDKITAIGVAFEDLKNPLHTQAAILSITQVPGTKVIFEDAAGQFVGSAGFTRACQYAATGQFPEITLKDPPETKDYSVEQAIAKGTELLAAESEHH